MKVQFTSVHMRLNTVPTQQARMTLLKCVDQKKKITNSGYARLFPFSEGPENSRIDRTEPGQMTVDFGFTLSKYGITEFIKVGLTFPQQQETVEKR